MKKLLVHFIFSKSNWIFIVFLVFFLIRIVALHNHFILFTCKSMNARVKLNKWRIFDYIYFYSQTFIKETKEEKQNQPVWFTENVAFVLTIYSHFLNILYHSFEHTLTFLRFAYRVYYFLYEHMVFAHTQLSPRVNIIGCSFPFGYSSFIPLSAGTLVV